jgi:hypothetical protein
VLVCLVVYSFYFANHFNEGLFHLLKYLGVFMSLPKSFQLATIFAIANKLQTSNIMQAVALYLFRILKTHKTRHLDKIFHENSTC